MYDTTIWAAFILLCSITYTLQHMPQSASRNHFNSPLDKLGVCQISPTDVPLHPTSC